MPVTSSNLVRLPAAGVAAAMLALPAACMSESQPGIARDGILPFSFYNAGVQVFDVRDPGYPEIAACFVSRFEP